MYDNDHLDSFLFEFNFDGQLISKNYIRVVSLLERSLQLVELLFAEDRSMSTFSLGDLLGCGLVMRMQWQNSSIINLLLLLVLRYSVDFKA